jgi:pimeloyl-ACP methyl ester carboxylesterase
LAFLCACLTAMHPTFSEIVPFIAAREEILAAMLGMWAIYAFVRHRTRGGSLWPFYLLYAGALLSKETGIATILFVAGFDLVQGRLIARSREQWRGLFHDYFPAVALVFGYFCLRLAAFGHFKGGEPGTSDLSLSALANFHARFYETLFDPTMFALDRLPGVEIVASLIALAAVGWVALRFRELALDRIRALVYLGPVWYVCSTLVLYIAYYSPRHNILPVVGLFLFGGLLVGTLIDLGTLKRGLAYALIFPLLAALLLPPTIETSLEFRRASRTVRQVRQSIVEQTRDLPDGSTVLLRDVPQWGVPPWYFGWGLLRALRQPFTENDTANRLTVISPENLAMNEIRTPLPRRFDRVIRIDPGLVSPYMHERRALRVARDE